jgi:hypothetical protein
MTMPEIIEPEKIEGSKGYNMNNRDYVTKLAQVCQ